MKLDNNDKVLLVIVAILFVASIYMLITRGTNAVQAAEIPLPPSYPFEIQISPYNADIQQEILRVLNYIHPINHHIWHITALNYQELQDTHIRLILMHHTLLDQQELLQLQQESMRITQMWSIAISAFSAGLLLVAIFAIVWSKST